MVRSKEIAAVASSARARDLAVCVLTCVLLASQAAQAATTSTIASQSHTAASGETFVLCGQFLNTDTVKVWDGSLLADARILFRDTSKIMAVVPNGMSTGTLWVWIADGANSVTLNNTEPWWIQPSNPSTGTTVRIFGRNMDSTSPTVKVVLKSLAGGITTTYTALVNEPCVASFAIAPTQPSGTYNWWLVEPKDNRTTYSSPADGSSTVSVQAAFVRPATTVNVTSPPYGATADDATTDNVAFQTALIALTTGGGGTLYVPPGLYRFDQSGRDAANRILFVRDNVALVGAGPTQTILEFEMRGALPANVQCVALFSNSAVSSVTIRCAGTSWPQGGGDNTALLIGMSGVRYRNLRAEHINIDCDRVTVARSIFPMRIEYCDYSYVDDVDIYSDYSIRLNARQIRIRGVRHHGAREMGLYTIPENLAWTFSGGAFSAAGQLKHVIIENCAAISRWQTEMGHMKRFFVGDVWDTGLHDMYIARNQTIDLLNPPFGNSGECFLVEGLNSTPDRRHKGQIRVDEADPTSVTLVNGGLTYIDVPQMDDITPLTITITDGKGIGQIRDARLKTSSTLQLRTPFTVTPDEASTALVMFSCNRGILYDNDFRTSSPYGEASIGIALWAQHADMIVRDNHITGFWVGYMDAVGYVPSGTSSVYQSFFWNEIIGNTISNCLTGIITDVKAGAHPGTIHLGNIYRSNAVRDMRILPYWRTRVRASITLSDSERIPSLSAKAVQSPIYEKNVTNSGKFGFYVGPFAHWLVLRDNHFEGATSEAVHLDPAVTMVKETNTSNTLPKIDIASSTKIPYRTSFIWLPRVTPQWDLDYYAWGDNAGSITLTISDREDTPTVVAVTGATTTATATLNNYPIFWQGLPDGLHAITVSATDGKGTHTKLINLFVGGYFDDFQGITQTIANPTSPTAWSIQTVNGNYTTSRTATYYPLPSTRHYHDVKKSDWNTWGKDWRLTIRPVNQEVCFRGVPDDSWWSRSLVSFVKNHYATADSYMKLRLLSTDRSYYELYDYHGYSPYIKLRTLSKVVDGNLITSRTLVAAHQTEHAVILQQDGTTITAMGWGETLQMIDPNPLPIRTWEIIFGGKPIEDPWLETNAWASVDNLYFSKYGVVAPEISPEPTYVQGTQNTIYWVAPLDAVAGFLQWATNSSFSTGTIVGNSGWVAASSYTATGLSDGQTYYYRVKARNAAMLESFWSPVDSSTQDASPPNTAVSPLPPEIHTTGTVMISWTSTDTVSGLHGVNLHYRRNSEPPIQYAGEFTTSPIIFDAAAAGGDGLFSFYTIGRDNVGNVESAPPTADAQTTITGMGPPPPYWAPIPPTYTSGTAYTINWATTDSASVQFLLEWGTDLSFATITGDSGWTSATQHTVPGLFDGLTYYYRVKARNTLSLESLWSTPAGATHDSLAPITLAGPLAEFQTTSTFAIPWGYSETGSGLAKVNLFYRRGAVGPFAQHGGNYTATPVIFDSATTDGHYYFYTLGTDNVGNVETSIQYAQTTVLTGSHTTPTVAAEPTFTAGTTNTISWQTEPTTATASMQWSTDPSFSTPTIVGTGPWTASKSDTATSLTSGLTYYYRVHSYDADTGTTSPWSRSVSSTQDALPPDTSVGSIPTVQTSSAFSVPWSGTDTISGLMSVRLFYRLGPTGLYTQYGGEYTTTTTSISFNSALTGGDGVYYFYTLGRDRVGNIESIPSSADRQTTVAATPPAAPALSYEPPYTSGTTNRVSCNTVTDATEYYFQWGTNALFSPPAGTSGWISANQHIATPLTHNTTYYYRVKCRNRYLLESGWSNVANSTQDAVAPVTSVPSMPTYTTTTVFTVPTVGSDGLSGLASLRLFYKRGAAGYVPYGGQYSPGLVTISSILTGGDGDYWFYTMGTDNAGNPETTPFTPDAHTILFTVVPSPPVLESLPPYRQGTNLSVRWIWNGPTSVSAECQLQWALDSAFLNIQGDSWWTTTTVYPPPSWSPISLQEGQVYYYRVRARNVARVPGPWSVATTSTQDASPPDSRVLPLPSVVSDWTFPVNCAATDTVSGVKDIRLFYRHNGADPYVQWRTIFSTATLSLDFDALSARGGGLYEFYSIGRDAVGNTEAAPSSADTSTSVEATLPPRHWKIYP